MTRKDYELIANAIRTTAKACATDNGYHDSERLALRALAHLLTYDLKRDNARFSATRFLDACGVDTEVPPGVIVGVD